ncbi:zinc ribbon domain-containing protein [Parageobacillus sp. VR-IP]|uniref:zinc ribbon domain-containing protein n=1 Tax=Parageobacillus sp. VR-IP TaxID=2742205 RepID=UPI002810FAC6|nr:zinc ribbon domain-containing protein [Parageobacillus sp. VR-IP]
MVLVHPKNTSRTCPICGHVAKENRPSRGQFYCRACGHAAPVDNVAVENIHRAAVNQPNAAAN